MNRCFGFLLLALATLQTTAQEADGVARNEWPATARRAVPLIVARLTVEQRGHIQMMKKNDLIMLHHEWGMDIRNYLGLWRGNDRLRESICGVGCHPDDASMILMGETWEVLQSSELR